MLVGLSGFVPYFYSVYVMAVLGCYGIWSSIDPLSIFGVAVGVIWILLGYHMLRTFWIITELSVRRTEAVTKK
jgi:cytochrome c biogenesis protein CcdA